ncbi:MAG: DUF3846 domain-containing protein [Acidimicrobiales bacterium]
MKALLIAADGTVTDVEPTGLKEVQALVGGYIEAVAMPGGAEGYANEDGKTMGLPENAAPRARPARARWPRGLWRMPGDYLSGDVLVFGGIDAEGDERDVTQKQADFIRSRALP